MNKLSTRYSRPSSRCGLNASQLGRTLIELMISITIGLVIVVAILAVYTSTSSTGRQSEAGTRMSEDAAIAMNYMANYIRMSGFSVPRVLLAPKTVDSGTTTFKTSDSNFSGAGVRGCDNGFSNPTTAANALALECNTAASTNGNAIAIRFEGDVSNTSPVGTNPSDCLNSAVVGTVTSDVTGGALPYKLIESRFYVRQGGNSGTSELYCAGNGGTIAYAAQPIMQHVESMVFRYGVANDTIQREITSYMTATQVDAIGGSVDSNWGRVVSVKVCLVMRSEVPNQNGPATYVDCLGNVVASPGGFLRRAFTSVVTLRNRAEFVYI
ncbi:MAG: PilW family protein [Burkholderiales bacterium]